MDLKDLQSVLVIARELSFTRAAKQLYVSQPALTKRLQRVEADLAVRLFDRSTTRVTLTAAGAAALPQLEELVGQWKSLARAAQARGMCTSNGLSPVPLRLGVFEGYSDRLAAHLAEACPTLTATVDVEQPPTALRRLAAGELDAATVYELPGLPTHPAVAGAHSATLITEPQWVVVGRVHPLAGRDTVSVDDVVDSRTQWFTSPPSHPIHAWEHQFLTERNDRVVLSAANDASLRRIALGEGVALASPQNVPNEALVLLPLTPTITWHHYFTWAPSRVPPAAGAALLAGLRAFYRRQAQRHHRYWQWLRAHPEQFPGIVPSPDGDQPGWMGDTLHDSEPAGRPDRTQWAPTPCRVIGAAREPRGDDPVRRRPT